MSNSNRLGGHILRSGGFRSGSLGLGLVKAQGQELEPQLIMDQEVEAIRPKVLKVLKGSLVDYEEEKALGLV